MTPELPSLANLSAWQGGWRAPDRRPIYEWAFDHIELPVGVYAIAGRFQVQQSRYLMAPFDAIQDMLVREVNICGAIQTGKTLIADIATSWIMVNDPGPIMWTFQADEDAKEHMLTRVWPLWMGTKALEHLWPKNRHLKNNQEVYFGSFFFLANGANPNSLQSKSIRWKFNSELWLPAWQPLYKQAVGRVTAFERTGQSKVVNDSQSGHVNDVMDKRMNAGHYARWSCACPECKNVYPLRATQKTKEGKRFGMIWNEDAKRKDGTLDVDRCAATVRWQCACGHELPDSDKTRRYWNDNGIYVAERPTAPNEVRSYWWGSIHVHPMHLLAKEKAEALNLASRFGLMDDMKDYTRQRENEPWEEVHLTVEISSAVSGYKYADYANGEKWEKEAHRIMSIDRQAGIGKEAPHRWVEIRAFAANGDSRQLWFGRLETKEACRDLQHRMKVQDRCVWQDMRFEKALVLEECAQFGWFGVWADDQNSWTHYLSQGPGRDPLKIKHPYSPIQKADMGNGKIAHFLHYNETYMSDILHNLLSGRGVKFEMPDDVSQEYVAHLKAEHKIEKRPGVFKWVKLHSTKANHGRDTSKQTICFAVVIKLLAAPTLNEEKAA